MAAINATTDITFIQLLTSDEPNEDIFEDRPVLSISESRVLHHATNQSRDRWLKRVFPEFDKHEHPNHDLELCGRFLVTIGPHLFLNTAFYTVCYHPGTLSDTEEAIIAAQDADKDDHLYHLLEAVHLGSATDAEMQELSDIWQTRYKQLSRPSDLVLQFAEHLDSFRLFPRTAKTTCDLDETGTKVTLQTMLPFNAAVLPPGRPPQIAQIEIFGVSAEFREVLSGWIGDDQSTRHLFSNLKSLPPSHLLFQLPVSGLSRTIESATNPRSSQEENMRQRAKRIVNRMKEVSKLQKTQRDVTNGSEQPETEGPRTQATLAEQQSQRNSPVADSPEIPTLLNITEATNLDKELGPTEQEISERLGLPKIVSGQKDTQEEAIKVAGAPPAVAIANPEWLAPGEQSIDTGLDQHIAAMEIGRGDFDMNEDPIPESEQAMVVDELSLTQSLDFFGDKFDGNTEDMLQYLPSSDT